jgi:hypothetical protein
MTGAKPARVAAGRAVVLPKKPVVQRSMWIEMQDMSLQLKRGKLIDLLVEGDGLSHGSCLQKPDHQLIQIGPYGTKNVYYLPWKNGDYTEGTIWLNDPLKYFFTAPLSGCSIWCKYTDDDVITIRHEARTKPEHHKKHLSDRFTLVFNSNESVKYGFDAIALEMDQTETHVRKLAIDFMVYGEVTDGGMTFYVQERRTRTTTTIMTNDRTERNELVREIAIATRF